MKTTKLAFYRAAVLVESEGGRSLRFPDGDEFHFDGTGKAIHEANQKEGIELTEENVLSYLRFFCSSLMLPIGPATLLETTINGVEASTKFGCRSGDEFILTGFMLTPFSINECWFSVLPNGQVEMKDDFPVVWFPPTEPRYLS